VQASFFPIPEFYFHFFRRPAFGISYHAAYEYMGLLVYKWKGYI
jgi:hypothetical protein